MTRNFRFWLSAAFFAVLAFAACDKNNNPSSIVITPEENGLIAPGESLQLAANTDVTWSATSGTIDATGFFTASGNQGKVIVTATSKTDNSLTAEHIIVVTPLAELLRDMRKGGYILYFRHGIARTGIDDFNSTLPQWWTSCDSTIARQLSPEGYVQCQEIGAAFQNIQLPLGKTYVSEFCRCIETAKEMGLDASQALETSQALTYTVYGETDRYERIIALANQQAISDKLIFLIAHSFPSDSDGPLLQMGDAAIYRQHQGGAVEYVTTITTADWTSLK